MIIFDYLKDIVVSKKGAYPLEEYVPFLINRWLSFISPTTCMAINESINGLGNLDKNIHYKLLLSCFPSQKYMPRINYVKKIKNEPEDKNNNIKILSKTLERSEKEIQQMLDFKQKYP